MMKKMATLFLIATLLVMAVCGCGADNNKAPVDSEEMTDAPGAAVTDINGQEDGEANGTPAIVFKDMLKDIGEGEYLVRYPALESGTKDMSAVNDLIYRRVTGWINYLERDRQLPVGFLVDYDVKLLNDKLFSAVFTKYYSVRNDYAENEDDPEYRYYAVDFGLNILLDEAREPDIAELLTLDDSFYDGFRAEYNRSRSLKYAELGSGESGKQYTKELFATWACEHGYFVTDNSVELLYAQTEDGYDGTYSVVLPGGGSGAGYGGLPSSDLSVKEMTTDAFGKDVFSMDELSSLVTGESILGDVLSLRDPMKSCGYRTPGGFCVDFPLENGEYLTVKTESDEIETEKDFHYLTNVGFRKKIISQKVLPRPYADFYNAAVDAYYACFYNGFSSGEKISLDRAYGLFRGMELFRKGGLNPAYEEYLNKERTESESRIVLDIPAEEFERALRERADVYVDFDSYVAADDREHYYDPETGIVTVTERGGAEGYSADCNEITDNGDGTYTVTCTGSSYYGEGPECVFEIRFSFRDDGYERFLYYKVISAPNS